MHSSVDMTPTKVSYEPSPFRLYLGIAVLVVSYAMLIPGLFMPAVHFSVGAFGFNAIDETRSTVGTAEKLWHDGFHFVAFLIALYSIVIPGIKLALLIASYWTQKPLWLSIVQQTSKWAASDAFAVVIMCGALRMNVDGINSTAQLKVGFVFFLCYCLLSTAGVIILGSAQPRSRRATLTLDSATFFVGLLYSGFVVCLHLGWSLPMLKLHLHASTILGEFSGDHTISAKELIQEYQGIGGGVGAIAASLLLVFGLVVPITEMVLNLLVVGMGVRALEENCERVSHFAMLDVMVMGAFVAALACAASGEGKLTAAFMSGFWFLLAAAACHMFARNVARMHPRWGSLTRERDSDRIVDAELGALKTEKVWTLADARPGEGRRLSD